MCKVRGCVFTLSLTVGSRALKHVARNTPPPNELHRDNGLLYLCALSQSTSRRRTGTSTPASIRPNKPSRPSSLATRICILMLQRHQSEWSGEHKVISCLLLLMGFTGAAGTSLLVLVEETQADVGLNTRNKHMLHWSVLEECI